MPLRNPRMDTAAATDVREWQVTNDPSLTQQSHMDTVRSQAASGSGVGIYTTRGDSSSNIPVCTLHKVRQDNEICVYTT